MDKIGVSVIITTYNQEEYIATALEGAIGQKTNFEYEILIHDDASTDKTAEIINKYAEKYPKLIIPFYEEKNQFAQCEKYLSCMLEKCRGKYIATCDGDDYWIDDNKLQLQYDFMETHYDFSLCTHNTKIVDAINGKERLYFNNRETGELSGGEIIEHVGGVFHTSSHFFRRKDWYDKHQGRDLPDMCRVCYLVDMGRVWCFNEVMSVYRLNTKGSWTITTNDNNYNLMADFISRMQFFDRYDKETNFRWHKNIANNIRGLNQCICFNLIDYREAYRGYSFKKRFNLLIYFFVDCFKLNPYVKWVKPLVRKIKKIIKSLLHIEHCL